MYYHTTDTIQEDIHQGNFPYKLQATNVYTETILKLPAPPPLNTCNSCSYTSFHPHPPPPLPPSTTTPSPPPPPSPHLHPFTLASPLPQIKSFTLTTHPPGSYQWFKPASRGWNLNPCPHSSCPRGIASQSEPWTAWERGIGRQATCLWLRIVNTLCW